MGPGLFVIGLREAADQILKDVAHIHSADLLGREVTTGVAEIRDHLIKEAGLIHVLDLGIKVHAGQNIQDIIGKAVQISTEIIHNILRIGKQRPEGKGTCIIELIPGGLLQKAVLHRQLLDLLIGIQYSLMRGKQAVMEALHHRHRKDHETVLMGLIGADQVIGHRPDEGSGIVGVLPYGKDLLIAVRHHQFLQVSVLHFVLF